MTLYAVVFMLLFWGGWGADFRDDKRLIGWRGDSYKPQPKGLNSTAPWVQVISWKPRSNVWHNFISEEEAKHIADLAWPTMQRSTVVGVNGSSVLDDYRTSYGTFVNRCAQRLPGCAHAVHMTLLYSGLPRPPHPSAAMRHGVMSSISPHGITAADPYTFAWHKHTALLKSCSRRLC